MKGIVFSEFNEMVEAQFSPELADRIIGEADLESGGAYTAVGTYPHEELVALVGRLSAHTGIAASALVKAFGQHLAGRFTQLYPGFFEGTRGTFDFLSSIEGHVHVEVRKLYPDAELPTFESTPHDDRHMTMRYQSRRPFADLAEGLILGCAAHFGERIAVQRHDDRVGDIHSTTFELARLD